MQIFVTNKNPNISAERLWANPTRARKMITESMQILACCQQRLFDEVSIYKVNGNAYKTPKSRMNHPVVKWASTDTFTMLWLLKHVTFLYGEYKERGGRSFKNICPNIRQMHEQLYAYQREWHPDKITFLNFAKAKDKDLDFTHIEDVFEAYDKFLTAQGS